MFVSSPALKPIEQLYNRAIKIFNIKLNSYHRCKVLEKHNFLDFENLKVFKNLCYIHKCLHGPAPTPLNFVIPRVGILRKKSHDSEFKIQN